MPRYLGVPEICPRCESPSPLVPSLYEGPRWIYRAKLIVIAGSMASAFLAAVLIFYASRAMYDCLKDVEALKGGGKGVILNVVRAVCFLVSLIPALICARVGATMPKVRKVSCSECHWVGNQVLMAHPHPVPTDDNSSH